MPVTTDFEWKPDNPEDPPANGGGASAGSGHKGPKQVTANRANAQKSTGPCTEQGMQRVAQNLRAPLPPARLLGLAEATALKQEPGAAEQLYRKLIEPYGNPPALLALHFEDLARLQLELRALERIRDAQLEHHAQRVALKVRRLYREMDRQLGVTPKDLFEKGLCNIEDSPAKFKMQIDALSVLKSQLQRGDLEAMEPALRQLYGNAFNPSYERAQLICIDCQRLMSPTSEPFNDGDLKLLLRLVDREIEDAMEGYELELDERTKTLAARLAELAPTREDHWLNVQIDRLRRAVDRKQWVITGLVQVFKGPEKSGIPSPEKGPLPPI